MGIWRESGRALRGMATKGSTGSAEGVDAHRGRGHELLLLRGVPPVAPPRVTSLRRPSQGCRIPGLLPPPKAGGPGLRNAGPPPSRRPAAARCLPARLVGAGASLCLLKASVEGLERGRPLGRGCA